MSVVDIIHYNRDLQTTLSILDRLNNVVTGPRQREILETSLDAMLIVLDLYEADNR